MQLDLKNVRVTYTLKEVVVAVSMLITLTGHVIRTELQHRSDEAQIERLSADVTACKQQLAAATQRAGK
jgi:hypothetical protein